MVKEVRVLTGHEKNCVSTLKRFKKEHTDTMTIVDVCKNVPKKNKKRGPKVNSEFEDAVLG